MTDQITNIEEFTAQETMQAVLLWCYNWTQEDFKKAFKNSKLGWDYHWNKLQGYLNNGHQATSAIVNVILNMDNPHQKMLLEFIYAKSVHTISSSREWNEVITSMETE